MKYLLLVLAPFSAQAADVYTRFVPPCSVAIEEKIHAFSPNYPENIVSLEITHSARGGVAEVGYIRFMSNATQFDGRARVNFTALKQTRDPNDGVVDVSECTVGEVEILEEVPAS